MSGTRFCKRTFRSISNLAAGLIVVFFAWGGDNSWARAEQEPNDRYEQANAISLGEEVSGFFDTYDEPGDNFKIVFPGPGTATFTLFGHPNDCVVQFLTREWVKVNNLATTHYLSTPGSPTFSVEFVVPADKANKDFHLSIRPVGPYAGGFARYDYRITQCSKGGPLYYEPPRNGKPRDGPPKETSTLRTYRFKVSFNAQGGAQRPPFPVQPPIVTPPVVVPPQPPTITPPLPPQAAERILIEAENEMESSIRPLSERPSRNAKEINPAWRPPYSGSGDWYLAVGGEFLRYQFNVQKGGTYYVWVRDYVDRFQPKGVRRISVEFDGRPYGAFPEVDIPAPGDKGAFGWHRIGNGINLTSGTHAMKVTKEATTAGAAILDAFYLTTDPNDRPAEK